MDGVLFDSERLYQIAMTAVGEQFGYPISKDLAEHTIGLSWDGTKHFLVDRFGPYFPLEDFVVAWKMRLNSLRTTDLILKKGVREILSLLEKHNVPCAIATGSSRASTNANLGLHGLSHRFLAIVTEEDCSCGKPDPEPFLRAASLLGVDNWRCLAIEDSYNGVRSATRANMDAIMVPDIVQPTNEMRSLCIYVAKDLLEVRDRLRSLLATS